VAAKQSDEGLAINYFPSSVAYADSFRIELLKPFCLPPRGKVAAKQSDEGLAINYFPSSVAFGDSFPRGGEALIGLIDFIREAIIG